MKLGVPACGHAADMSNKRRAEMRVIWILAVCVLAAACERDVPVAPERPAHPATAVAPAAALSAAERAALAAAITDAQAWLLPKLRERDITTDAIAGRFVDLATSLARADTGTLGPRVAAARQDLEAGTAGEPGERLIELAALGLVLDGVEAVIQGRLRLVPLDAAAPDSPGSLSEDSHPKLDRSRP